MMFITVFAAISVLEISSDFLDRVEGDIALFVTCPGAQSIMKMDGFSSAPYHEAGIGIVDLAYSDRVGIAFLPPADNAPSNAVGFLQTLAGPNVNAISLRAGCGIKDVNWALINKKGERVALWEVLPTSDAVVAALR